MSTLSIAVVCCSDVIISGIKAYSSDVTTLVVGVWLLLVRDRNGNQVHLVRLIMFTYVHLFLSLCTIFFDTRNFIYSSAAQPVSGVCVRTRNVKVHK